MAINNSYLYGMEAEVKMLNNIISSTLKGYGKLVLISCADPSETSPIMNLAKEVLKLKQDIFSCFIRGEELKSYDSLLKHILAECGKTNPGIFKRIIQIKGISIDRELQNATDIDIMDILEIIIEEYPLFLIIDNDDTLGDKALNLLDNISCFIPYNRLTLICTVNNTDNISFIHKSRLKDFCINMALTPSKPHEITSSHYIASLLDKSGLPSENINSIIKLFLKGCIHLIDNNASQIYGLVQYLNDDDSLDYYEAMAYYIMLLLKKGRRYEALSATKEINRKLCIRLKECEDMEQNRLKALKCFMLGNYYFYINKGYTAINIMKKALTLLDKDFLCEYQNTLGLAYLAVGDWASAEKCHLTAYEACIEEGIVLPHLLVNLILLYNYKCEFNRASYYYKMLKEVKSKLNDDFLETLFNLLFLPIESATGTGENINNSYEVLIDKLINKPYWGGIPLYHFSYLRLYIIAGDHLFRCKDYKDSMRLYEKALISYDDSLNEPYIKDFINVRIMACRSMLGFKAGRFVMNLNLDHRIKSPFHKYMLCSAFFFAYLVYQHSGYGIEAKKWLIRSIRYARASGNLIYKSMGYYELHKLYMPLDPNKSRIYQKKYMETASAMGICPNNIPYTFKDCDDQEDERINYILEFIRNNYKNDISLSTLSNELHLSETHICHLIKKRTNYTFKELLLQTRIQEARKMLTDTVFNVSDIAVSVGFSSSKYFCEVFKDICGFTPGNYRKKHHNHNIKEYIWPPGSYSR